MFNRNKERVFNGKMEIRLAPTIKDVAPFIEGPCRWTYSAEDDVWHSAKNTYPAHACTPLFDDAEENLKTS